MKKIFFVLVIFISACGYQTESSMSIDEILEIKDPCEDGKVEKKLTIK